MLFGFYKAYFMSLLILVLCMIVWVLSLCFGRVLFFSSWYSVCLLMLISRVVLFMFKKVFWWSMLRLMFGLGSFIVFCICVCLIVCLSFFFCLCFLYVWWLQVCEQYWVIVVFVLKGFWQCLQILVMCMFEDINVDFIIFFKWVLFVLQYVYICYIVL